MPVARVQHTYNHLSGMPEHAVVNTLYFDIPTPIVVGSDSLNTLVDAVFGFYDATHGAQTLNLRAYIAESSMAPARHTVKVYNMDHDEPRAPILTETTANGSTNNAVVPMPAEVACCLSYRGALVSGTQAARRRGRIYIGPLGEIAAAQDAAGWNRPSSAFRTNLTLAAQGLVTGLDGTGWVWVVHSGGGGGGDFDFPDVYTPITDVWVDDAWDTQRRRGADASLRTQLTITGNS